MNTLALFITEIIISLCLSGITLWVLNKPLINILEDLCPTKKQSHFWVAYTRIMLSITPLLMVLFFTKVYKYGRLSGVDSIYVIKASMIAALTGLLIGMLIVGRKVIIPASKKCNLQES